MSKRFYTNRSQNKNSRITTEWFGDKTFVTATDRRDEGTLTARACATQQGTELTIRRAGAALYMNGHEARTLYKLLETFYSEKESL